MLCVIFFELRLFLRMACVPNYYGLNQEAFFVKFLSFILFFVIAGDMDKPDETPQKGDINTNVICCSLHTKYKGCFILTLLVVTYHSF